MSGTTCCGVFLQLPWYDPRRDMFEDVVIFSSGNVLDIEEAFARKMLLSLMMLKSI